MFGPIARFEIRYQLKSPVFWVAGMVILLISFAAMNLDEIQLGAGGNVHKNAPFAVAQITGLMSILYMLVTTALVANVVIRDDDTGFGPILRATPISRFDYLNGRFAGAVLVAALGFLFVPAGIWLGSSMPWLAPETVGPNSLAAYAYAYLVLGLPTLLFTAALLFAIATITRSMLASYVAVIALLSLYTVTRVLLGGKPALEAGLALGDPFGLAGLFQATKYWTASERNSLTPPMDALLSGNRLIVLVAGGALLALANLMFRTTARGAGAGQARRRETGSAPAPAPMRLGAPARPRFDAATARAQLWARTRLDLGQVFRSPAYGVLLLIGLLMTFADLWFNNEIYGTAIYPLTTLTITTLQDTFTVVPFIIAIYYAGELVWRERDRRTAEIIEAAPVPGWALALPKMLAIALALISTLLVGVAGAMIVQTVKGFGDYRVDEYLLWFVAPQSATMVLVAVLAVFFQVIAPHKFVGWGLMALYLVISKVAGQVGLQDHLFHYLSTPEVPLSDINGAGNFWIAEAWFDLYWSAFGVVLAVLALGLWRRGMEKRLRPRLRALARVLRGAGGAVVAIALVVFVGAGGVIYWNTHILNPYRTSQDDDRRLADKEKQLLGFETTPQPTPISERFELDLNPHAHRLMTRGSFVLENRTGAPLPTVHLNADPDLRYLHLDVAGAHLDRAWPEFNYRIYRFDRPLAPGARTVLSFTSLRQMRGFRDTADPAKLVGLVDNGSFVYNFDFAPSIGIDRSGGRDGFLKDRAKRRRYGLPPELHMARLEDDRGRAKNDSGNSPWVTSDITVTTDADQTPIAPGAKVRDVVHDGRRTARFVNTTPIVGYFSVQSGRYAETHVSYEGVDIGVYYHPGHAWNVARMIAAARASLDYYQASFGPYQFRQLRFVEFPNYAQFAEAFAGTIPWSEGLGFTADLRHLADGGIDYVTLVGAHEIAHQWWGHQEVPAEMQGGSMIDETLAHYSALMVMQKLYGPDRIRTFLKYELDRYLRARGDEAVEELPLARVENQDYIHYRKGAVVMYLLQDQIGEAAVNRALRGFLADWRFKGPPYPSSKDLIARFRAEAPSDKQQLITDLFEKITLYDLKAVGLTSRRRADGRYDVHLTVSAGKAYADGRGRETPAAIGKESFDIGLFDARPGEAGFSARNVILFRRARLRAGPQSFDFVLDRPPRFGGVDPYNKYIDRNDDDNVAPAGG